MYIKNIIVDLAVTDWIASLNMYFETNVLIHIKIHFYFYYFTKQLVIIIIKLKMIKDSLSIV